MIQTAVLSVIFHANLPYLPDFFKSLVNQTDRAFDLLLVNDNVPNLEAHLAPYKDLIQILVLPVQGSIAAIREQAFDWARTLKYKEIIFNDTDDCLSKDRVAVCRQYLADHSVVISDLIPFQDRAVVPAESLWRARIQHEEMISSKTIENFNIAGLGNTAIRIEVLKKVALPSTLQAVDWFLFFHLLQNDNGIFVHEGTVLYRQHSLNMIGAKKLTAEKLFYINKVKINHYGLLAKTYPELRQKLDRHIALEKRFNRDKSLAEDTVMQLNAKAINYFWWEETEYIHE